MTQPIPGVLFWDGNEDAYDRISFNGVVFDETSVVISGTGIDNKIDIFDKRGQDGATVTPRGGSPRKPTITVTLYSQEHSDAYDALLRLIAPQPGKTQPQPVATLHPDLARYGILLLYVDKAPILSPVSPGIRRMVLQCVEWLAPKPQAKKTATPKNPTLLTGTAKAEALKNLRDLHHQVDTERDPKTGRRLPYAERQRLHKQYDDRAVGMGLEPPPSRSALFP